MTRLSTIRWSVYTVVWATVWAGLLSCGQPIEPVQTWDRSHRTPGNTGRSVLWLSASQPEQNVGVTDSDLMEKIVIGTLDLTDETGWDELTKLAQQVLPAIRMAALTAGTKNLPDKASLLALGLLDDLYTPIAERAHELVRAQSANERTQLLDRGLGQKEPWIRRGAVLNWPVLLGRLTPKETTDWFLKTLTLAESTEEVMTIIAGTCREPSLFLPETRLALEEALTRIQRQEQEAINAVVVLCEMVRSSAHKSANVEVLTRMLGSDHPQHRRLLADLLFKVAPRLSLGHGRQLVNALNIVGDSVNDRTALSLYKARAVLGDRDALSALAKLALDGDQTLRMGTVTAFLQLADRGISLSNVAVVDAVEQLLLEEDKELRWRVVMLSGQVADLRFVRTLHTMIGDRDPRTRSATAYALGQLNAQQSIDVLITHGIEDEVLAVRDASYVALHRLVHDAALPPREVISDWLDSPPPNNEHPFWGRDRSQWRLWYQRRGQSPHE